jgi:hypothetical protein
MVNIMKKQIYLQRQVIFTSLMFLSLSIVAFGQTTDIPVVSAPIDKNDIIPEGWFKSGTEPQDYLIGVDRGMSESGSSSSYIKSKELKPSGSCDLMQEIKADNYRGERVRLTGYAKTKFVSYWAGLFMIAEDDFGRPISYDNMQNRPIVGTSDWVKYEIVIEIPKKASKILFGASLHGKGEIWIDDLKLLVVNNTVPLTDLSGKTPTALYPDNMDFEK